MEVGCDILDNLDQDAVVKILLFLDPADVIRVGALSRAWHDFVISHRIFKQICQRIFPQLAGAVRFVDVRIANPMNNQTDAGCSRPNEFEQLKKEHKMYVSLFHGLRTLEPVDCISGAVSASSTDNFPEESIHNTLEPRDQVGRAASYWSSAGQSNPSVPEKLLYKLASDLCLITEISVKPFKAYFQPNSPIYSAKAVRFRMGHQKVPNEDIATQLGKNGQLCGDDKFVWTYTSQEFPMTQESIPHKFALPEPVLCVGGFLEIELLGRVQRQDMDDLFYICVAHVQVVGRSLSPVFEIELLDPSGRFLLKYDPEAKFARPDVSMDPQGMGFDNLAPDVVHARRWEDLFNLFRGNFEPVDDSDDEHPDFDEDFEEEYVL